MPAGFNTLHIWNMALSHVGSKSVIESQQDRSPAAQACNLWYPLSRVSTLELHNWGFARCSQALAGHTVAAPTNRWAFRYQVPSDCTSPRLIENPMGPDAPVIPFEKEQASDGTDSIVTNAEAAVLIYTKDEDRVALMPLHFMQMVAIHLGHSICMELTGKTAIKDRLMREWQAMAISAPAVDVNFGVGREPLDASWIRERN